MARYSLKFKERVVARLLPPESSPVEAVSQTVGISVGTLERWRAEVLAKALVHSLQGMVESPVLPGPGPRCRTNTTPIAATTSRRWRSRSGTGLNTKRGCADVAA
jgi:transposase-like protein